MSSATHSHPPRVDNGSQKPGSNLTLIVLVRALSDAGMFLSLVISAPYVATLRNAAIFIGIYLTSRVSGGLLASVLAGTLYRKFSPIPVFHFLNLSRALVVMCVPFMAPDVAYWWILFTGVVLGLGTSGLAIGINNELPNLVDEPSLPKANSAIASLAAIAAVFGALCGGLLVGFAGYETAFVGNGVLFLASSLAATALQRRLATGVGAPGEPSSTDSEGAKQAKTTKAQWRPAIKKYPVVVALLIVALLDTFGSAEHNVGFPILAEFLDPTHVERTFGFLISSWATGKLIGSQIVAKVIANAANLRIQKIYLIATVVMSTSFVAMFAAEHLWLCVLCGICAGIGDGFAEVCLISSVQKTDEHYRLLFLGAFTFMHMTGFAFGMLLVSPFFDIWHHSVTVGTFHGLPVMAAASVLVLLSVKYVGSRRLAEPSHRHELAGRAPDLSEASMHVPDGPNVPDCEWVLVEDDPGSDPSVESQAQKVSMTQSTGASQSVQAVDATFGRSAKLSDDSVALALSGLPPHDSTEYEWVVAEG